MVSSVLIYRSNSEQFGASRKMELFTFSQMILVVSTKRVLQETILAHVTFHSLSYLCFRLKLTEIDHFQFQVKLSLAICLNFKVHDEMIAAVYANLKKNKIKCQALKVRVRREVQQI